MSELLTKVKLRYIEFRTKNVSYERSGIRPTQDWRVFLTVTGVVLLISAICGLYFYMQIDAGNLFNSGSNNSEREIKIDDQLLSKTVADLNSRQSLLSQIKQGRSIPSDPSF